MSLDPIVYSIRDGETITCRHCGLHQYPSKTGRCPKCQEHLGVEFLIVSTSGPTCANRDDDDYHLLAGRIGAILRQVRIRRGLSQQWLSNAAGIGRSYISRAESGHVIPTINAIHRLARALGLSAVILRFESPRARN
jgi:ribosome-binding protein aMBF1 (putative translation factor)